MVDTDIELFISQLYCSAPRIAPEEYRVWALEQLSKVLDFDAALWGTGNLEAEQFHYVNQVGLDERYGDKAIETLPLNPILDRLISDLGKPIDMADVFPDEAFYDSELYARLFKPYGIKRILASAHIDDRSGLYTILSLYRYDRNQRFTEEEKQLQSRLIYHLVSAASHAFFLHLQLEHAAQETGVAAICDSKGGFYEAQPQFLQLLAEYYPDRQGMGLPFELPAADQSLTLNGLVVDCRALGELFVVSLRMNGPLDRLTNRESQIVQLVCKGLSFKEAAKTLDLAPSTVSNHLYRIYEKLGISSRVELAKLLERTGNIL